MLTELHIENLGVIERVNLVIGPGLTVLTGETGAGKTMLVEAINLLVGGRADPIVVRRGASEARVEGRFVMGEVERVLARVVPVEGRSRAYVDGRLATAATLGELGSQLVDLHGQHAHQSLLAGPEQRSALDRFGRVDLGPLREARARLAELDAALATLGGDERSRAREMDLLRFQVSELDGAGLVDANEDEALEQEEQLLADATEHRMAAWAASEVLGSDGAVSDLLGEALARLGDRRAFADVSQRLMSLQVEASDLAAELRSRAEAIEEDPRRLAEVRARRQRLVELRRKYGDSLADVIAFRDDAAARLAELEGFEERAAALERERAAGLRAAADAADAVARSRREAAPRLAQAVQQQLSLLAMPKVAVDIAVEGPAPADQVTFLLAAGPGAALLPLNKVASGGELARSMLALRLVLTEAPDTLVFDEVDAGIGGSAANAVARALGELGRRHQVLVVTHLAQVAAVADRQVVVTKEVRQGDHGEETVAVAIATEGEDRVDEVARMLSGGLAADAARRHARELLAERPTPAG